LAKGFRAWLQAPDIGIESCTCGWARELGPHFRIRRLATAGMGPAKIARQLGIARSSVYRMLETVGAAPAQGGG
jgi:hypothetical protein